MDERFLTFFIVVAAVAGLLAWYLSLRHRKALMEHEERMAALEKGAGIPAAPESTPGSVRTYLLRGMIWAFAGVALSVLLLGVSLSDRRPEPAESRMVRAQQLSVRVGIPLEQAVRVIEQDHSAGYRGGMSPAAALIGLVPVAVGLAYLLFYATDERRKRRSESA